MEESELYEVYDNEERDELLFKILATLIFGG